jgi:hypothetical protein
MWTCTHCGEVHEDQFKECWKCADPAQSPHVTAEAPKPTSEPPPRPLRSLASILVRVVFAFIIGIIAGAAIVSTWFATSDAEQASSAYTYALGLGAGLAFATFITFWIIIPYEPRVGPVEPATVEDAHTNTGDVDPPT